MAGAAGRRINVAGALPQPSHVITNGVPSTMAVWRFTKPVHITPQQTFSVKTEFFPFADLKEVREAKAKRTSKKRLVELSGHENALVRVAVRDNPRTPEAVRALLALEEPEAVDFDALSYLNQFDSVKLCQIHMDSVISRDVM
jgi:hypothetical protein